MEDTEVYNQILLNKRQCIFKIPENRMCVFVFSGGLDSVITCARLMEDYDFDIFPIFYKSGQNNLRGEEKSLNFFTKFFLERYKTKFHVPMILKMENPPLEFKPFLHTQSKVLNGSYPARNTVFALTSVQYAFSLSCLLNMNIRTIFNGAITDDTYAHSQLAAFRSNTINVCENMGDWEWQITGPNIDLCFDKYLFGKKEEIEWGKAHNIPMEKTFTCISPIEQNGEFIHCGKCFACKRRIEGFQKNNYKDLTRYGV